MPKLLLLLAVLLGGPAAPDLELWWFASVEYPNLAHVAQIGGVVIADATLDREGKVATVTIVSGHAMLVDAVRHHMKKLRFSCQERKSPAGMKYRGIYEFEIDRNCDENAGCYEASTVYRDGRWIVKASKPQINN